MILYPITLLLSLPVVFSYGRLTNLRNRRMPVAQSGGSTVAVQTAKRNVPFIIRVPYSKIVPSNALFSHSVSWKAKQTPPAGSAAAAVKSAPDDASVPASSATSTASQTLADLQVSQFHSQDTNGQVIFGFNAPDQMRIEQRNADGTVHGTYSYVDPYGQIIKRQYWDTGAGFHVTSNSYPLEELSANGDNWRQNAAPAADPAAPYTPEVQAARDLHFQLYQQALASFLPNVPDTDVRRNASVTAEDDDSSSKPSNGSSAAAGSDAIIVTPSAVVASGDLDSLPSSLSTSTASAITTAAASTTVRTRNGDDDSAADANHGSVSIVEPDTENGSIVIQKPEYLRISWTTENKKYRVSPLNANHQSDDNWSVKSATSTTASTNHSSPSAPSSDISSVARFILQGSK